MAQEGVQKDQTNDANLYNAEPTARSVQDYRTARYLAPRSSLLDALFTDFPSIDSIERRSLRVIVDASAFFHDNEFKSPIRRGYSLPGTRLQPRLAYNPIPQINIEVGASMLFFNGANRYPCFAYHDIGVWKGAQYQKGSHVLPWVRLQGSLRHLDFVLGNIYGAANHHLITPLFNAEQNLSADPEMGMQILLHRPHIELDTWLNWQSYQFDLASHQEAFSVGTTAEILWSKARHSDRRLQQITFFSPIQLVMQHRGGEQDKTKMGVQTLTNISVGTGLLWQPKTNVLNTLRGELNAVASYQQKGRLWPFKSGFLCHAGLQAQFIKRVGLALDYCYAPKQFASIFGSPFFNTFPLNTSNYYSSTSANGNGNATSGDGTQIQPNGTLTTADGTQIQPNGSLAGQFHDSYSNMHNLRLAISYAYTFAKAYTLGAQFEALLTNAHSAIGKSPNGLNCSFGLYFRVTPSFFIKRF